jgi:hypothetical protein
MLLAACGVPTPQESRGLKAQANYWQQLGSMVGSGTDTSLVSDGSSNTIAFSERGGSVYNISVRRWNGSTWSSLGVLSGSSAPGSLASLPSLALDSAGNPTVAWEEWDGSDTNIYVQRFNGSSWTNVGTGVLSGSSVPSLALDSSGNPVVAGRKFDGSFNNIYVQRFNGSSWTNVGTGLSGSSAAGSHAYEPSLALDNAGNPVVAWREWDGSVNNIYVQRFNGTSWVNVGTGVLSASSAAGSDTYNPSLALDSAGNPVVAWQEWWDTDGNDNILVQRFNGTSWVNVGTAILSGSDALSGDASVPSLALDSAGNPTVAWYESDGSTLNIYVQQFTGSSWVNVGTVPLDTNIGNNALLPSVSLVNGSLNVAWQEGIGNVGDSIYVKRYITNSWLAQGGALDRNPGNSATEVSMGMRSGNVPIAAWQEHDGVSDNVHVKVLGASGWVSYGTSLDVVASRDAGLPSLAVQSTNLPVVAWQEFNGTSYDIRIKRRSGSNWVSYGTGAGLGIALDTTVANNAFAPSLAVDTTGTTPTNNPTIAWYEEVGTSTNIYVKRYVGTTLTALGGALDNTAANDASNPSLALNNSANPIVAWQEFDGTSTNIYVKQWSGTAWAALGSALDMLLGNQATDPVIAIRTDGRPVVAWQENGNIYVKRWTGSVWTPVGTILDKVAANEALKPSLKLRTDNIPVVSWQEWNGSSYDVWVKRFTGSSWTLIGVTALDNNLGKDAERPSLVLRSDNNPVVGWDEVEGSSETVFVKRF